MRDRYKERVTVRISKAMLDELNEFSSNYNISKNSILRQAITSFLNTTPTAPTIKVKTDPATVVMNDDPFSSSIYNW